MAEKAMNETVNSFDQTSAPERSWLPGQRGVPSPASTLSHPADVLTHPAMSKAEKPAQPRLQPAERIATEIADPLQLHQLDDQRAAEHDLVAAVADARYVRTVSIAA